MTMTESEGLAIAAARAGDYDHGAAIARAAGLYATADAIAALKPDPPATTDGELFTPEELMDLSRREYRENKEKVERSMAAHSAEYQRRQAARKDR